MPIEAQFSSVNGILVKDFNQDGSLDLFIAGNLFASEVETTRNDAGIGLLLVGNGDGTFRSVHPRRSGISLRGDVKDIRFIRLADGSEGILVANNNDRPQLLKCNLKSADQLVALR